MEYQEKNKIEEKVFAYAIKKSGEEKFKYAYAFGLIWALLSDEQLKYIADFIEKNGVNNNG